MKVQQGEYLLLNVTALGTGIGAIAGNSTWNLLYRFIDATSNTISTKSAQFTLVPRSDAGGGQLFQADGTIPAVQFPAGGELVSVVVNTDTGSVNPAIYQGVAYVQVFVSPIAQVTMDKTMSAMLIAETLSSEYSCAWPGNLLQKPTDGQGYPVNLLPGDPPAGSVFQYSFSRQFRTKLTKVLFQLSKGPGDDSLVPYVGLVNPSGKFHTVVYAQPGQPHSTTYWYQFGAGLPASVTAGLGMTQGLPADLLLVGSGQNSSGDQLMIGWSGGQSGTIKISNVAIGMEVWNEYD